MHASNEPRVATLFRDSMSEGVGVRSPEHQESGDWRGSSTQEWSPLPSHGLPSHCQPRPSLLHVGKRGKAGTCIRPAAALSPTRCLLPPPPPPSPFSKRFPLTMSIEVGIRIAVPIWPHHAWQDAEGLGKAVTVSGKEACEVSQDTKSN